MIISHSCDEICCVCVVGSFDVGMSVTSSLPPPPPAPRRRPDDTYVGINCLFPFIFWPYVAIIELPRVVDTYYKVPTIPTIHTTSYVM